MRHQRGNKKLGRPTDQRIALLRSLSRALILNPSIVTTDTKSKELVRYLERVVTLGKDGSLAARRQALRLIPDKKVISVVFTNIAKRYEKRAGGYIKTIKVGFRKGDAAPLTKLSWVE